MRRWFIAMCAINLGMAAGDIPNWAFEGLARPWYPAALWSGSLLFWICSSLMPLAFTFYLVEYLSPRAKVHRHFLWCAALLCAAAVAGSVLSLWNGMFFTVTPENIYQRGDWFWLSQALPFLMYAMIAVEAIKTRAGEEQGGPLMRILVVDGARARGLTGYYLKPLAGDGLETGNLLTRGEVRCGT